MKTCNTVPDITQEFDPGSRTDTDTLGTQNPGEMASCTDKKDTGTLQTKSKKCVIRKTRCLTHRSNLTEVSSWKKVLSSDSSGVMAVRKVKVSKLVCTDRSYDCTVRIGSQGTTTPGSLGDQGSKEVLN